MYVVFLGNTLEEYKVLSLLKVAQWCDFKRLLDVSTQIWIVMKQSTNLELKTWFLAWKNVRTLTHSQQQAQGPKTQKRGQQSG